MRSDQHDLPRDRTEEFKDARDAGKLQKASLAPIP